MKILPRESEAISDLVQVSQATRIVEFGSWQGRSALAFLQEATKIDSHATITCVDTWLGSSEHWNPAAQDGEWSFTNLEIEDGEPRFIETFREAIRLHGFTNNVKVLRCPSQFSQAYLLENFDNPDLFYIDADHSTPAVLKDFAIAERVTREGVIAGDDWCWPSVQRAVVRQAIRHGMALYVAADDFAWVALRRSQKNIAEELVRRGWAKRGVTQVWLFLALNVVRRLIRRTS